MQVGSQHYYCVVLMCLSRISFFLLLLSAGKVTKLQESMIWPTQSSQKLLHSPVVEQWLF